MKKDSSSNSNDKKKTLLEKIVSFLKPPKACNMKCEYCSYCPYDDNLYSFEIRKKKDKEK